MAETKKKVEAAAETEVKAKKAAPKKAAAPKAEEAVAPKAPAKKAATKKAAPAKGRKAIKPKAKKEAPAAPKAPVTEARAMVRSLKTTPRKVRLVIDLVRGKDVDEALAILNLCNHMVAVDVAKLIKSASANATNNFGLDGDKLYVSEIWANDSLKMRRYLPRAKGSASGMVKRFSNVYVVVKERN